MARPVGVRIVLEDGTEFEPELRSDGVDDGVDVWTAVFEGRFVVGKHQIRVDVLPPMTAVQIESAIDGLDVQLGIWREG